MIKFEPQNASRCEEEEDKMPKEKISHFIDIILHEVGEKGKISSRLLIRNGIETLIHIEKDKKNIKL